MKPIVASLIGLLVAAPCVAVLTEPPKPGPHHNAQISTDTNITQVQIDWESANGYLFGVVRLADGKWRILRSDDAGRSWVSRYLWELSTDTLAAAVVGDYLYVLHNAGDNLRLRRASSETGLIDASYGGPGYVTVVDVGPETIEEVAIATNADDGDSQIWVFVLTSGGTIRAFHDSPADGESFVESSPGISDAAAGLSAGWNLEHAVSEPYVGLVYVASDDDIRIHKRGLLGWDDGDWVASGTTGAGTLHTSLAAFRGHWSVAFERDEGEGMNAICHVETPGYAGWSVWTVGNSSDDGGDFFDPLVSAGSRTGLAVAVQQDTGGLGGDDTYWFDDEHNFDWSEAPRVALNDQDFSYGPIRLQSDFRWLGSGWGLAYVAGGKAWFSWSEDIRYAGFEDGFVGWSQVVGAP